MENINLKTGFYVLCTTKHTCFDTGKEWFDNPELKLFYDMIERDDFIKEFMMGEDGETSPRVRIFKIFEEEQ